MTKKLLENKPHIRVKLGHQFCYSRLRAYKFIDIRGHVQFERNKQGSIRRNNLLDADRSRSPVSALVHSPWAPSAASNENSPGSEQNLEAAPGAL